MLQRIPAIINYFPLNYNDSDQIIAVMDEDDNGVTYISFLRNIYQVFGTLIVKQDSSIELARSMWIGKRGLHISPTVTAIVSSGKISLVENNNIIDELPFSRIVKYVFNPHERIGALILVNNSVLRRRRYAIIGFNDGSYNVIEAPIIDITSYANGFLLAYKDGDHVVVEKIPYGEEYRYYLNTNYLRIHNNNNLIALSHSNGTTIIDKKNMNILYDTPFKDIIPLGIAGNTIVFWSKKTHTIYIRKNKNNQTILLCNKKPVLAGVLEGRILLKCSNNIIEIKNNNWRLHESSKELMGENILSTTVVEDKLVIGTLNRVIVWSKDKYYFKVEKLLGISSNTNNNLIIVDKIGVGIINLNKTISPNEIIVNDNVFLDDNLRLKRRLKFYDSIIISNILSNENKVVEKRNNLYDIVFVNDNPVVFNILYYGTYKVQRPISELGYYFELLSSKIIEYDDSNTFLLIEYKYLNPLDKDIVKPIVLSRRTIGYLTLKKRSKGRSILLLALNNLNSRSEVICIDTDCFATNKKRLNTINYLIEEIALGKVEGRITLSVKLKLKKKEPLEECSNRSLFICARGFLNGCTTINIFKPRKHIVANIPVTLDPTKGFIEIITYMSAELSFIKNIMEHDKKTLNVVRDKIVLIPVIHKDELYIIIDKLPRINNIILTTNNDIKEVSVRKQPLLLEYKEKSYRRDKANHIRIAILLLSGTTLHYSERIAVKYN